MIKPKGVNYGVSMACEEGRLVRRNFYKLIYYFPHQDGRMTAEVVTKH